MVSSLLIYQRWNFEPEVDSTRPTARKAFSFGSRTILAGVAPDIAAGETAVPVEVVRSPGAAFASEAVNATPDASRIRDVIRDEIRRTMTSNNFLKHLEL